MALLVVRPPSVSAFWSPHSNPCPVLLPALFLRQDLRLPAHAGLELELAEGPIELVILLFLLLKF